MRPDFVRPVAQPELAALPVHLIVRDYPETLAVFRRFGVDLSRRGGEPVLESVAGDAGELVEALAVAIAWRER
jgi:hypothetical protein